jgi:hypothetical protein
MKLRRISATVKVFVWQHSKDLLENTWVTSKVMTTNFFGGKHVTVKKVKNILMKGHDIPLRLA